MWHWRMHIKAATRTSGKRRVTTRKRFPKLNGSWHSSRLFLQIVWFLGYQGVTRASNHKTCPVHICNYIYFGHVWRLLQVVSVSRWSWKAKHCFSQGHPSRSWWMGIPAPHREPCSDLKEVWVLFVTHLKSLNLPKHRHLHVNRMDP